VLRRWVPQRWGKKHDSKNHQKKVFGDLGAICGAGPGGGQQYGLCPFAHHANIRLCKKKCSVIIDGDGDGKVFGDVVSRSFPFLDGIRFRYRTGRCIRSGGKRRAPWPVEVPLRRGHEALEMHREGHRLRGGVQARRVCLGMGDGFAGIEAKSFVWFWPRIRV